MVCIQIQKQQIIKLPGSFSFTLITKSFSQYILGIKYLSICPKKKSYHRTLDNILNTESQYIQRQSRKKMQGQNGQLKRRLDDLILISDFIKIDMKFILGYIIRDVGNGAQNRVKETIKVAELAEEAVSCELISRRQFLSLIAVLGHIAGQNHFRGMINLVEIYQQIIESLIYDSDYLQKQYFSRKGYDNNSSISSNSNISMSMSMSNISSKPILTSFTRPLHIANTSSKIQSPSSIMLPTKMFSYKEHEVEIKQQQQISEIKRNKSNIAECPVCLIQIKHHNICILACGHIIHQQCFQACMKEPILNKKFPLKCPFEECSKHIQTEDIQQYLPKDLVEKYYQFTLHNFVEKNTKNMSWCPTPGCSNAFQFDEGISGFNCMKCEKSYCLACKTQMHQGKTCKENREGRDVVEEDMEFIEFAKGARYKQCPQCRFWVEKSEGCCHMTCRCEYQFCYVCGVKYGDCNCQQTYDRYYGSDDGSQQSQVSYIERNEQQHYEMQNQQEDSDDDEEEQSDQIAQQKSQKQ